jgi:limonene-1,2-epoxide hydrolase
MNELSPSSAVLKFVEFINEANLEGIASLTAEEYTFTDVAGDVYIFRGAEAIKASWDEYLSAYPNYKIHVHRVLAGGNGVAIIGRTTGSHVAPEIEEKETVLWTAEVRDGLVAEWRIYSDQERS